VAVKKQEVKAAPKRRKAARKPFDFQPLRRMALWGIAAVCALLFAVLTSKGEAGAERLAAVMASFRGQEATPPFDARVETRKLADGLRGLSADNGQLRSRLGTVERHMDDVTGSLKDVTASLKNVTAALKKEIEDVKAEAEAPRPAEMPQAPATPGTVNSTAAPARPPSAAVSPFPAPPPLPAPSPFPAPPPVGGQAPPAAKPTVPGSSSLAPTKEYAVDIGSAVSIQTLRARWAEIRAAHPQLFQGLTATVITRGIPQADRSELRLVLGPLPNFDAAARLCASLTPYRVFCQPTPFDGQHVALQ
jgi:hypothetical protein